MPAMHARAAVSSSGSIAATVNRAAGSVPPNRDGTAKPEDKSNVFLKSNHSRMRRAMRSSRRAPRPLRNAAASTPEPYEGPHDPSGRS